MTTSGPAKSFDISRFKKKSENISQRNTPKTPDISKPDEYLRFESETLVTDTAGNDFSLGKLMEMMPVNEKMSIHCPIPEHEDNNPSAFIEKQREDALFICCMSCGGKGFFSLKTDKQANYVPSVMEIDKARALADVPNEDLNIKQIIYYIVEALPQIASTDPEAIDVGDYVDNIITNSLFPPAMINGHVRFYQSGYWKAFDSKEMFRSFVRACIEKSRGSRLKRAKHVIDQVCDELSELFIFDHEKPGESRINLNDHVLAIKTGEVEQIKHSQDFRFTYKLPYSYDESVDTSVVRNIFLGAIEESEAVDVLFEFIGSAFIDKKIIRNEEVLLFVGEGSNGKSVVLELIKATLGYENVSTLELQDFNKDSKILMAEGKLLNIGSELDPKRVNTALLKKIASSEPIAVDVKYSDARTIESFPKMIFAANRLPTSDSDTSHGYFRRFKIIPFDRHFDPTKTPKNFMAELLEHKPAVMKLIIEGAERLLANGQFTHSPKIEAAKRSFEQSIDSTRSFVSACEVRVPEANQSPKFIKSEALYTSYESFCLSEGLQAKPKRQFIDELRKLGFTDYKSGNDRGIKAAINNPPANRIIEGQMQMTFPPKAPPNPFATDQPDGT